jgi:UDP-N-acetyl-2-amino-2-deoxyglucuronate dehydrogenase
MNFALIGAGGYVAPRHMQAIKDTGNELIAALDPNDSVGILDKYFPDCKFFTKQEAFDRHIMKFEDLDFVVVCSPNYLHESHCKLGMRLGANVICEKPLSTTVENLRQLQMVESQLNRKVFSILQLRLHPSIKLLKDMLDPKRHYDVKLDYITPRGPWYFQSWKGNIRKSGGIETNIGIHFFDMLIWLFGDVLDFELKKRDSHTSVGVLHLNRADVTWNLSLDKTKLPDPKQKFFRRMTVDGEDIRFDNVFSELHTESYTEILNGRGFGIEDSIKAIDLVERIRNICCT